MKCYVFGKINGKASKIEFEALEGFDAYDIGRDKGIMAGMDPQSIKVRGLIVIQSPGKTSQSIEDLRVELLLAQETIVQQQDIIDSLQKSIDRIKKTLDAMVKPLPVMPSESGFLSDKMIDWLAMIIETMKGSMCNSCPIGNDPVCTKQPNKTCAEIWRMFLQSQRDRLGGV